jgi:hypothetical protein
MHLKYYKSVLFPKYVTLILPYKNVIITETCLKEYEHEAQKG